MNPKFTAEPRLARITSQTYYRNGSPGSRPFGRDAGLGRDGAQWGATVPLSFQHDARRGVIVLEAAARSDRTHAPCRRESDREGRARAVRPISTCAAPGANLPGVAAPASASSGSLARRLMLACAAAFGVALMLRFGLWRCPVAELFGVPCPGCGLTRAALALAVGDLERALGLHPLSPLVLPWFALVAAGALVRGTARRAGLEPGAAPRWVDGVARALERAAPLLLVLLVGVWVARFFGAFGGPVPVTSHLHG